MLARVRLLVADSLNGTGINGLSAPVAELFVARHFALVSQALDVCDETGVIVLYLDAVGWDDLPPVGLVEGRDVARSDVAPALSPELMTGFCLIWSLDSVQSQDSVDPHAVIERTLLSNLRFLYK